MRDTGAGHGEMYQDFVVECTVCPARIGLSLYKDNFEARVVAAWNTRVEKKAPNYRVEFYKFKE